MHHCTLVHTAGGVSQAILFFGIQRLQCQDQLPSRHDHASVQVQAWSDCGGGLQGYGWIMDRYNTKEQQYVKYPSLYSTIFVYPFLSLVHVCDMVFFIVKSRHLSVLYFFSFSDGEEGDRDQPLSSWYNGRWSS